MTTPVVLKNAWWEWGVSLCIGGACVCAMMALMKTGGRPYSLYSFSKAAALTAVALVLCAVLLGTIYRTTSFASAVRYRRPLGLLAAMLGCAHAVLSFFAFPDRYDWTYFARNWESLLYGFVALVGFLLLWLTSYSFAHRRMGGPAWKHLQNGVYVLLALAVLHVCHCGKPLCWLAWLQGRQGEDCNRGALLPPLSLILFLGWMLVIVIRLLEPLWRRDDNRAGDEVRDPPAGPQ